MIGSKRILSELITVKRHQLEILCVFMMKEMKLLIRIRVNKRGKKLGNGNDNLINNYFYKLIN